jgi:hypothetical protein
MKDRSRLIFDRKRGSSALKVSQKNEVIHTYQILTANTIITSPSTSPIREEKKSLASLHAMVSPWLRAGIPRQ